MKTTLEIPDALFRRVKSRAAERGQTLKEFVSDALQARLAAEGAGSGAPPWMEGFGKLQRIGKETARIQARVDAEFGAIEAEDRA